MKRLLIATLILVFSLCISTMSPLWAADGSNAAGFSTEALELASANRVFFDFSKGCYGEIQLFWAPLSYRYVDICHCFQFDHCEILWHVYMLDPDGDGLEDDGLCVWEEEEPGGPGVPAPTYICVDEFCS